MKTINLLDCNFAHHKYSKLSCDEQYSDLLQWNRDIANNNDLIVITDYMLGSYMNYINRIAWLCEPRTIINDIYEFVRSNYSVFTKIFTHDKFLLDNCLNAKFVPVGGSWIWKDDQKIYDKTKLLDIIASSKNLTEGHQLRHSIINTFRSNLVVYGRNLNTLNYKLDGLKDFKFQIVVENGKYDYYFTEKLIDCFVTGTVPIYWGCPSIGDFFNINGILTFNNLTELGNIINNISDEKYEQMKPYIQENFEKAKNFLLSEEYIIKNNLL